MISALLPLPLQAPTAPANDHFMFTADILFNPLAGFEKFIDDDCSSCTPSVASSCQSCQVELCAGCVVSDYEQDACKQYPRPQPQQQQGRRVHFAEEETVVTIPSHRDYTDEEYDSMWSNPDEIEENAYRNRLEYRYEGHWKMVLEEDQLILCSDGQLYHPVTVGLYLRHLERQQARKEELEAQRVAERKRKSDLLVVGDTTGTVIHEDHKKVRRSSTSSDKVPTMSGKIPTNKPDFLNPTNIIVPDLANTTVPRLTAPLA